MNANHLSQIFTNYIENFEYINNTEHHENYKWIAAKKFRSLMDAALTAESGTHVIMARSGGCSDIITVKKVDQPDRSYLFQKETVVNWFDRESIREDCFSVNDTLGEMLAHPKAGAIVKRLIEQASKSRGEVAEATSGNENMLKMMSGMTLSSLLKKAGDAISKEQAKALNDMLQKISKQ